MNIHSSSHVHYIRVRSGTYSKQFDAIECFIYKLIGRELFEKPCWSHVEVFEFSGSCFSVLPLREDCLSQSPGNHHSERETSEECFHLCTQEGGRQNWSLKNRDYFSRFSIPEKWPWVLHILLVIHLQTSSVPPIGSPQHFKYTEFFYSVSVF